MKAIEIKECILGPDDFEVGLSLGHLASLYNYHMDNFEEAEKLYLRSIKISRLSSSSLLPFRFKPLRTGLQWFGVRLSRSATRLSQD